MSVALGLGLLAVLVVVSGRIGDRSGVSPRVAAGAHLVTLVGWGLLPTVWLACAGGAVGSWVEGIRAPGGGCLFGWERGRWLLLVYAPAMVSLGVLAWHGARLVVAARRVELRGRALAGSARQTVGGVCVWVVPSSQPAAYAGGLWRPRAVVTSALLGALHRQERRAVCVHEAAHVRLGHPRVLLIGGTVAGAYGCLLPVRRAWEGLRRDIEAAADDEAVREVGAEAVLAALVRSALLAGQTNAAAAAFGEPDLLRYRIARLQHARPVKRAPTALVGSSVAALVAAMAWSACVLAGVPATHLGLAICLIGLGVVALRPTWARGEGLRLHSALQRRAGKL